MTKKKRATTARQRRGTPAALPIPLGNAPGDSVVARPTRPVVWTAAAGLGGTGTAGTLITVLTRLAADKPIPAGLWLTLTGCLVMTTLSLCFRYLIDRTYADTYRRVHTSRAQIGLTLAATHQQVLVKAAGEPESSEHYVDLSDAISRYTAILHNGVQLADDTHSKLYRRRPPATRT